MNRIEQNWHAFDTKPFSFQSVLHEQFWHSSFQATVPVVRTSSTSGCRVNLFLVMIQIINLFFYYFLIIFSAIGYGMLASFNLRKKERIDFGFFGLTGILILILFSYFSNLFFVHGYLHNSIIILIGFSIFNFILIKNFSQLKKNFHITIIVFSILFIGLLMYKNHDDFFYYHFQYSLSLINFKKIFGLGLMGHGYRTPSSLFYLNSLFYLPGIKFYLLKIIQIFFLLTRIHETSHTRSKC